MVPDTNEKNDQQTEKKPNKIKTTIYIDENLWREFQLYVVQTTRSVRSISEYVEKALREYLDRHSG